MGNKPSRFKLVKPRVKQAGPRVKTVRFDDEVGFSEELIERKEAYRSARWKALRKEKLEKRCWCGCGRYASRLDHLLGHDDAQAARVAEFLVLVQFKTNWRDRFFTGPFISLSEPCHNSKTWHENRGRLREWIEGVVERAREREAARA